MSQTQQTRGNAVNSGGPIALLWRTKAWWLMPLVILALLLIGIYVLVHLSVADPETYPTTSGVHANLSRSC
jgi:hypothetical protein